MDADNRRMIMKRVLYAANRIVSSIIPAVFLFIAIYAAYYGLVVLIGATKEILVAVIAGSASLLSVFFTFITQRSKELELAEIHRNKELELARIKTTQENYSGILRELAPFIRDSNAKNDEFSTALLHAWVVGSPEVVRYTDVFMKEKTYVALDNLLNAMRNDVGLVKPVNDGTSTRELFPVVTPKPVGGLT